MAGLVTLVRQKFTGLPGKEVRRGGNVPATLHQGPGWPEPESKAVGYGGNYGKSFLFLVIIPVVVWGLYSAFWESRGYVAEARVTVRAAQEQRGNVSDATSLIGKLTGGARSTQQDSYIILNYVKSHAIIIDLGGESYLEKIFSNSAIDYFSRLETGEAIEDLVKYWSNRVSASVDTVSGILTIRVTAYQPEDALKVTQDVVQLSEKLVNTISLRNRKDALDRAVDEVEHAAQRLADAREKLLQFRNANVLIDPASRATSIGEMIGKLTLEKIEIENALTTLSTSLSSNSPSQRLQHNKLDTINQQLASLKNSLTSVQGTDTVATQIGAYERLKLDEQFSEKIYTISQSAYLHARQEFEKQQLYLITVVPPTLPESATYPKIGASTLLLFVTLLVLWAIGALVAASINDHMV
ncbi:MAG: hypothetical protein P4L76_01755 [Beijerinckiaceae bacterium]|nr:hypothetical protein [Beijerinckiaceae bacterium]